MKAASLLFLLLVAVCTSALAKDGIYLIENKGQVRDQYGQFREDIDMKFGYGGLTVFIGAGKIQYQFLGRQYEDGRHDVYRLDVELLGANENALREFSEEQYYYERHYGSATEFTVRSYKKATYKNIYPGIDWVICLKNGEVEYEFIVNDGADLSKIKLAYKGAEYMELKSDGSIVAKTPLGNISESAPYSYTESGAIVGSSFRLEENVLSFNVAPYKGKLIIDPTIEWATYYHGNIPPTHTTDLATYGQHAIYMCGRSDATDIATIGAHQTVIGGTVDGFLVKFDSDGNRIWASYYGGTQFDNALSLGLDNASNIYVTGMTLSSTGISTLGSHQVAYNGGSGDAYLAKFDSTGQRIWGTYYGGSGVDGGTSVYSDGAGNVVMCGTTQSTGSISTNNSHQPTYGGNEDAFVAKFDPSGVLQWATYYGGSDLDQAWSIYLNGAADILILGKTASLSDIASSGAHQTSFGGGFGDLFVAKFNTSGVRQWGTYYGGGAIENPGGVWADANGEVYLSGWTNSSTTNIASTGCYQPSSNGGYEMFLAKLNSGGQRVWGTYYGGTGADEIGGYGRVITRGEPGTFYINGGSNSSGLATNDAWQQTVNGSMDMLISKFDTAGFPIWTSYYGGGLEDYGGAVSYSGYGQLYICGHTYSANNIATVGAYQTTNTVNTQSGVLARIDDCTIPAQPLIVGDTIVCPGSSVTISVVPTSGVLSYNWTLPGGWTGSSISDTIVATTSSTGGTVSVSANNYCATSQVQSMSVSVYPMPSPTITIIGNSLSTGTFVSYQWYLNGNPVPGANAQTYNFSQQGNYWVSVTDSNGCSASSSPFPVSVTNVEAQGVAVYPNPSGKIFYVEVLEEVDAAIDDITGREVWHGGLHKDRNTIILPENIDSGVYILKLSSEKGLYIQKLLIQ